MMMWPVVIMAAMVIPQALATTFFSPKLAQQIALLKELTTLKSSHAAPSSHSATPTMTDIFRRIESEFWTIQYSSPRFVSFEQASNYVQLGHLLARGLREGGATCHDAAKLVTKFLERPGLDQAAKDRLYGIKKDVKKICCTGDGRLLTEPKTQVVQIPQETSSESADSSSIVEELGEFFLSLLDDPQDPGKAAAEKTSKLPEEVKNVVSLEDVVQESGTNATEGATIHHDEDHLDPAEVESIFGRDKFPSRMSAKGGSPPLSEFHMRITLILIDTLVEFIWEEPVTVALLTILGPCTIFLLKLLWEEGGNHEVLVESEADEDDDEEESAADALPEETATSRSHCELCRAKTLKQSDQVNSEIIASKDRQLEQYQQDIQRKDIRIRDLEYDLKDAIIERTHYREALEEANVTISALKHANSGLHEELQDTIKIVERLREGNDLAKEGWVKLDELQVLNGVDPEDLEE